MVVTNPNTIIQDNNNPHGLNSPVNSVRLDFEKSSHVLFKRDISKTEGHRLEVLRNEKRYSGKS